MCGERGVSTLFKFEKYQYILLNRHKITRGHDGSAVSTLASGTKLKAPKCSAIKIVF